ncbi:MAG: phosphatidylinositol-specific phospholipase C/glycerophosphodiester phosphodiesterase family protein [Fimbriimonadaceae bacterium]|nr:phosphatidylinositol-specific phospholipase C/glycerophosphodiester phosphodiesterase family protein [Fimbriimonadaceae bacterium]
MFSLIAALLLQSPLTLLERAHSHNDYTRARPLFDALDNGFSSVEVDIYLVDGKLLVGHDRKDLKPENTLERMYLGPLAERMTANGGWVYPKTQKTFWVLVDIKTDGAAVYEQFKKSLALYPTLKCKSDKPSIRFVISGDRPIDAIVRDGGEWAGIDGRPSDLDKNYSPWLMPWISDAWKNHFSWLGMGEFPAVMGARLRELVATVHRQDRKIRFWGAPDTKPVWEVQWKAGVDFLNTDRPSDLRAWMLAQKGD